MAYSRPPWEIEGWPTIWVNRSLVELEHYEPAPEFGQLAQPGGPNAEAPGP